MISIKDWDTEDVVLLRSLATALVDLEKIGDLDTFTMPYPDEAQRVLNRTVLLCLRRQARPPRSLPELIDWATEPVADWPLSLPQGLVEPDDRLLDARSARPTELCHEWAERARDVAVEHRDRQIIRRAKEIFRGLGEPDGYAGFRRLLVEQPVLTEQEGLRLVNDLVLAPARDLIQEIYREVPPAYLNEGAYATCERCLTLLTPMDDDEWWCERDQCRRIGPPPVGRRLRPEDVGELLQLERPLRQFVTGPGRAEMRLAYRLTELGLSVELWPGFDNYDLRVTFPGGRVWAIDVKDWAHPGLLGRAARPIHPEPPYDEAFWVVPAARAKARAGYVATFERNRPDTASGLPLMVDDALVRRARKILRERKKTDA
ncbi:HU-CCDC81 and SPOR domain-containing protein [Actinomadura pelletieri]|uniref:pPIWI_RE_Y domain-containing protein n=1 Tax=Actinomadura pelletieri TaxID=111805 RepID=UPI000EB094CA|nr:HU-CCDC81 and SPOR domain-containing protein [Actinomadura pelletieri]